jgi:hypothetical protein
VETKVADRLTIIAIFWLPLIAGIVLGGISPSIWYSGNKIFALWTIFFGIVLLLLTATFQIQSYIQTTILQPQLEITIPEQKSILTWDPSVNNLLNVKAENDSIPPGSWRAPIFTIKNTAPIYAQDVKVKWSAEKYDFAALIENKDIFKGRKFTLVNDEIIISAPGEVPAHNSFNFSAVIEKPFITKSLEIFIPLPVWNTAALFFLATMPANFGQRSDPYYFDLEISWNIPENTKSSRHRIKAVATNIKATGTTPTFQASVVFSVENF